MFKIIWAILSKLPSNKLILFLRLFLLKKRSGFKIGKNVKIGKNFGLYPGISLSIEDDVIIGNNLSLKSEGRNGKSILSIGKGTLILSNVLLDCTGNLSIGKNCHIGRGSKIYTHFHDHRNNLLAPKDQPIVVGDVNIGDGTTLYEEVVVMSGINIAKNCIVGLRTVVTKSFEEEASVIAGIPAKTIGRRFNK